jgi:flagellar biosynthetic protein FlhB
VCFALLEADKKDLTGFLNLQLFAATGEDKTEEPTPHRLREARKRGQVMKSLEFNAAINMLGMVFFFLVFWRYFRDGFMAMFTHYLGNITVEFTNELFFEKLALFSLQQYLSLSAPFLLAALLLGLLSNVMQVGFLVSTEVVKPQLNRINPVEGFQRIFSRRALFELIKSLLKITVIAAVSYIFLRNRLACLIPLLGQEIGTSFSLMGNILKGLVLRIAGVFVFLALLDFIYQRFEFQKNLRMTLKEVKEEFKQLEGDPHVRSRLREKQRALARQRSLSGTAEATVVITNPTELAVALRYDEKKDQAPVVVALGAGLFARRVREIARENDIPIVQNPPLARLLYKQAELGAEIPVDLYQAVAEILAMVYQLEERKQRRSRGM